MIKRMIFALFAVLIISIAACDDSSSGSKDETVKLWGAK